MQFWGIHFNQEGEIFTHTLILFNFVCMWRTLPPSLLQTVFQEQYLPQRTACLFSYGKKNILFLSLYCNLINTVNTAL